MNKLFAAVTSLVTLLMSSPAAMAQDAYRIPAPVYRTGLYAAGGISYFSGVLDYFTLLNERDGGIGGVQIVWDECETEYNLVRGIECYEHQKKNAPGTALYFDFFSESITGALIESGRQDQISIISVNHGRPETRRGDVFPYQFPLGTSAYGFTQAVVEFIGQQMGGRDRLAGKTIVTLYHTSLRHSRVNAFMAALGEKYGFKHEPIAVAHPGNEQSSQWKRIRQIDPAWVLLRGWGVMNPVALRTAAAVGYPVSRIVGSEWSNSEADAAAVGNAADGYVAITVARSGNDYPLASALRQLYIHGKGNLNDISLLGSVYYNLGVWAAVMSTEALRTAQARFGKKLTPPQVRWGFENLRLSENDLHAIGLADIVPPIQVTCMDHAAAHRVRFHRWNAAQRKWEPISGWVEADSALIRERIDRDAAHYAAEHPELPQRDCDYPPDRDDFDI